MHTHLVAGAIGEMETVVQRYARNEKAFALQMVNVGQRARADDAQASKDRPPRRIREMTTS